MNGTTAVTLHDLCRPAGQRLPGQRPTAVRPRSRRPSTLPVDVVDGDDLEAEQRPDRQPSATAGRSAAAGRTSTALVAPAGEHGVVLGPVVQGDLGVAGRTRRRDAASSVKQVAAGVAAPAPRSVATSPPATTALRVAGPAAGATTTCTTVRRADRGLDREVDGPGVPGDARAPPRRGQPPLGGHPVQPVVQQVAEVGEQLDQRHREVGRRGVSRRVGELQPLHQHRPQRGVVAGERVVVRWRESARRGRVHRRSRRRRRTRGAAAPAGTPAAGRQVGQRRVQPQLVHAAAGQHGVEGEGEVTGTGSASRHRRPRRRRPQR